jgi:TRAP-type C4-dicarboxylate transport system permease small subunit
MMMIAIMTLVMLYEVFMRYILESQRNGQMK